MIHWVEKPYGLNPIKAHGYFWKHYFYFVSTENAARIFFYKKEEGCSDMNNQYVITKAYKLLRTTRAGFLSKWMCRLLISVGCFRLLISKEKPL